MNILGKGIVGSAALLIFTGCQTLSPSHKMKSIPQCPDGKLQRAGNFQLGQPWADTPEKNLRPTKVRLAWTPAALLIEAYLTDDDVLTTASSDNQKLWMLGDVFEVFLMVEGRSDYAEMHVAPNGKRMHLHLAGVGGKSTPEAEPLPFEKMCVTPPGFQAMVEPTAGGWKIKAKIPASVVNHDAFHPGQRLRVSFCRYDAGRGKPETLSTSANHSIVSFHRPQEWTSVILHQ